MVLILVQALVLLLSCSLVNGQNQILCGSTTWTTEVGGNGHVYSSYVYTGPDNDFSWTNAKNAAESIRACGVDCHLVTIHSVEEDIVATQVANQCDGFPGVPPERQRAGAWIGLFDEAQEGEYVWVTGEPYTYSRWCNGEPNDAPLTPTGEDHVNLWFSTYIPESCWNDFYPTAFYSYVVECPCDGVPSQAPSQAPSPAPSQAPSNVPSKTPSQSQVPSQVPSQAPSKAPMSGGAIMDPHFKTWTGDWYDFMGACDLHLLQTDQAEALDMTIDIRTKIRYQYSYIESAAIRIGEDILEVVSWGDWFLNGVWEAELPPTIAGFPLHHTTDPGEKKKNEFVIDLGEGKVIISNMKDMVSVNVKNGENGKTFIGSQGMMGEFGTGILLGRNGTVIEDPNLLAAEWQVRDNEPVLFQSQRDPQYPQQCTLPSPAMNAARHRRLGESTALEAARQACAKYKQKTIFEACIHDVIVTGDLEMADSVAF